MSGITIQRKVHFGGGKRKEIREGRPPEVPAGRIPRVSRLMALAIRLDQLLLDGEVNTYADLAFLGCVTRARVTQVMNLLNLAPDIQEAILHLPPVEAGRDPISEHDLRPIVAVLDWHEQHQLWRQLAGIK
jgi:hypothetical protein